MGGQILLHILFESITNCPNYIRSFEKPAIGVEAPLSPRTFGRRLK